MKNVKIKVLAAAALFAATAGFANAGINAYGFDPAAKNAQIVKEYKEGGFNPFWFQEGVKQPSAYSFDHAAQGAALYAEFKEGDTNAYGFNN